MEILGIVVFSWVVQTPEDESSNLVGIRCTIWAPLWTIFWVAHSVGLNTNFGLTFHTVKAVQRVDSPKPFLTAPSRNVKHLKGPLWHGAFCEMMEAGRALTGCLQTNCCLSTSLSGYILFTIVNRAGSVCNGWLDYSIFYCTHAE